MIDDLLRFNEGFVREKGYENHITSKYPDKKLAIVTCMDTRLTQLLLDSMGLKNGDAVMVKNAGGIVRGPFSTAVRSLLVGIYELGVEDIMIVGHTDCGAQHISGPDMIQLMLERGIPEHDVELCRYFEVDFDKWLSGFDDSEESVRASVEVLRDHPLIPSDVRIHGFLMDSVTGKLMRVC